MTDQLYKNLTIVLNASSQSQHFLSCTESQGQAYSQTVSSLSTSGLLTPEWWSFIFSYFAIDRMLFISVDFFLYSTVLVLLLQFGLIYRKHSASTLLNVSGNLSRKAVGLTFLFFCAQLFYCFTNPDFSLSLSSDTNTHLNGLYRIDYFTQMSKFFMFIIWLGLYRFLDSLAASCSQGIAEFPILSHLVLCFSLTMVSSGNFALLLICLEGFSLILYIMATIGRLHGGITAAAKYFAFGTAGSVLILWGAIHLYEITASMSLGGLFYLFESLNESFSYYDSGLLAKLEWAGAAVLVGLLVKLGAAPTHQWVPDVYSGVPLFVTAFYALFVKFVLYILFLRFAYQFTASSELEYSAAISLVVGCFGTLRQVEIKRFLAYGSITHMGFLLSGDLSASIIYLATYILASFVFFSVLLNLRLNGREFIYLSDLRHVAVGSRQWDRLLLVISLASMAGLPPFAGFYGKMLIWASLIEDIYLFHDLTSYLLLILNLSVSLIIIFYYMRLIVFIYLSDEVTQTKNVSSYLNTRWRTFPGFYYKHPYHPFSTLPGCSTTYLMTRLTDIRAIQGVGASLLLFWTFLVPRSLTFTVAISEVIVYF